MDTLFNHPWTLFALVGLPAFGIIARIAKQPFSKIAAWYLSISVFAIVVVMDSIFFPFIGGKDWFFRFAVELSLIFTIFAWAFEEKDGELAKDLKSIFKRPLVVAVSVFIVSIVLATIFANDVAAAFWSNYERGEGLFQILHYYVFFLLLNLLMKKEDDWKQIFAASLWASALMIVYGIFGNYGAATFIGPYAGGAAPTGFWEKLFIGRFQGSLGNPAYVAPYLIFSMFFAGYLWIRSRGTSALGALRNWGYVLLITVFLLFFILSQTRGAFLGLGCGIFVFLLYEAFSRNMRLRKWCVGILGVLIILGGVGFALRNVPAVQNLPEGRLLQISLSDSTAQTRFWTWGSAWQGFLAKPITGWGPENFTTVFDLYFNPRHYIPGQSTETWFDRAHDVFFDYLSEDGILGLASYLAIFVVFYAVFVKNRQKEKNPADRTSASVVERGLIFSLPVAYLIQGVALFDVLPIYIPLFLFLGFAAYYEAK
jgi:O-antigen ligase